MLSYHRRHWNYLFRLDQFDKLHFLFFHFCIYQHSLYLLDKRK
jgi:hypothetical protein